MNGIGIVKKTHRGWVVRNKYIKCSGDVHCDITQDTPIHPDYVTDQLREEQKVDFYITKKGAVLEKSHFNACADLMSNIMHVCEIMKDPDSLDKRISSRRESEREFLMSLKGLDKEQLRVKREELEQQIYNTPHDKE